ncbi:hypothetical protein LMG28614_05939 [Paraburkholderia ultramafica]|uniref:Radical SAM protein n=1 Tax=Paraburkholderia ultramafica TaxID=1544867 RepID=A0A6S7BZH0_9BURK|nr:hypothetical protein LMG28614_05939 [Paraburkholderia ultramafica]
MKIQHLQFKGRGTSTNANSRFSEWTRSDDEERHDTDLIQECAPEWKTVTTEEQARSIIARNDSPDVPFDQSINPYRGCEHGCSYCFARPTHAYLGLSPGLDFERMLVAKTNAGVQLRRELNKPGYKPAVIAMGTNTDPSAHRARSQDNEGNPSDPRGVWAPGCNNDQIRPGRPRRRHPGTDGSQRARTGVSVGDHSRNRVGS